MLIFIFYIFIIFFSIFIMMMCISDEDKISEISIIGEVIDADVDGYVFKDDSGYIYSKYIPYAMDEILDVHDQSWTECDKKYEIIIREIK